MSHDLSMQTLRTILSHNELQVYYQPQYHLPSKKFTGIEALLRWHHKGEVIAPNDFLPAFAANGLMKPLNFTLIKQVLSDIKHELISVSEVAKVCINLSYQELANSNFIADICHLTRQFNVSPNILEIELTESHEVKDIECLKQSIFILKSSGFSIALDDFCTGCSCLNHLRQLDINTVKVDKSFVQQVHKNSRDFILVESLISLAKQLEISCVVEGIENIEQLQAIESMQPDYIQGYYYAKPMRLDQLMSFYGYNQSPPLSALQSSLNMFQAVG